MASRAERFIARLAGKYPDTMPIKAENAMAANTSHIGMMDILVAP